MKEWKKGIAIAKDFFVQRDEYIQELKTAIANYGIVNLPPNVQRSIPTDIKVLYELPWRWNIFVRIKILRIGWMHAVNAKIKEVFTDE